MSRRDFIPDDAIARNQPPIAYTDGVPWLSRASWIAFARLPDGATPGGAVSGSVCKLVLWDLLYRDGAPTSTRAVAHRCGIARSRACLAISHLLRLGLVTAVRVQQGSLCAGTSYEVVLEAVARLEKVRG